MNNGLKAKMKEYFDKFEDGFPTMEIEAKSDAEYIKMIDECLKNNKDAYEMKMAVLDDSLIY